MLTGGVGMFYWMDTLSARQVSPEVPVFCHFLQPE